MAPVGARTPDSEIPTGRISAEIPAAGDDHALRVFAVRTTRSALRIEVPRGLAAPAFQVKLPEQAPLSNLAIRRLASSDPRAPPRQRWWVGGTVGNRDSHLDQQLPRIVAGPAASQCARRLDELGGPRVRSAIPATSRDPACDTTPSPPGVAVVCDRVVVACTSKPHCWRYKCRSSCRCHLCTWAWGWLPWHQHASQARR